MEPGELGEADKEDEAEQEQKFDGHDDEKPVSNERVCVSKEPVPSFQTLLRVRLETGRKHQIRAQMAHIGQNAIIRFLIFHNSAFANCFTTFTCWAKCYRDYGQRER